MDQRFERQLAEEFDGNAGARRVVVRQARDLADSGQFGADMGRELTADVVVDNLHDAPPDLSLPEKWNWWVGALELAYGGYDRFRVVRWAGRSD
ncbi:hypothetical protein NGM10_16155 (plasmid) [Halorussus salilacus]|uniref:hypothetical protein n=1 Tax=Halorussus salilacus TaxID=2953750 RepID=UPI0020A1088C|nr:hypothetical protein [Halorussus salilacus]USZ69935.1 hypothetical protein NGM10_16155 [Halorussus salilacus]